MSTIISEASTPRPADEWRPPEWGYQIAGYGGWLSANGGEIGSHLLTHDDRCTLLRTFTGLYGTKIEYWTLPDADSREFGYTPIRLARHVVECPNGRHYRSWWEWVEKKEVEQ